MRGLLALVAMLVSAPAMAHTINMRVFTLSDHLWGFYDGRPEHGTPGGGWADSGANDVGVATYVIHSGDVALVYDAYPSVEQARWVRSWLEKAGIHHFMLVNSHWHLDHVGGNAVYADSPRYATEGTKAMLLAHKAGIEAGNEAGWGPPAVNPLVLPDHVISKDLILMIGDVLVSLRPVQIHSADGLVIYLPQDKVLLAGDTLEDTLTFIAEPDTIVQQRRNLLAMRAWGFARILPNHGNPDVIAKGGYGLDLIDMTRDYTRRLVEHSHDADFAKQPIEAFLGDWLAKGTVRLWWAYRDAHAENLGKVAAAWKGKALPDFSGEP